MEESFREDVRIIWRFLSKYKKKFYVILSIVFFGSLVEAFIPYIYGKVVEFVIASETLDTIFLWLLLWFAAQLIYEWTRRYLFVNGGRISVQCSNDLILLLNQQSLDLKLTYHNKNKGGKLSSRYIKAGDALEALLESVVFWFGADILLLLSVLILIGSYVHWIVFVIVLISIVLFIYVSLIYSKPISEHILEVNKSFEDAYGIMNDSVANIKLVKANSGEDFENQKSSEIIRGRTMASFEKFWQTSRSFFFRQDIIIASLTLVSVAVIVLLFEKGTVEVGQVVAFIGYLGLLKSPLHKAGDRISHYRRWMATVRRGYALLEEEAEDYDVSGKVELKDIQGAVEFQDVSFAYNETREVLHNINLKVRPGEMVALVGESGVGKSTLVDLISKYIIPTSGKVFLDGADIQKVGLKNLRDNIAVVPQDVSMFNDTVRNNLIYGKLDATEEEIKSAIQTANAEAFIVDFPNGLEEQVGERGVQLSGGQKQRIAIARAVLKNPKVLILDEATSALDSKSEMLVQEAMQRLMQGRTTFVIAHRLSTIIHADHIVVFVKGRIAEQGTHEELLEKRGAYYKLYTLQSLVRDKRE
ncbi:MAG: ABC transporter ATP-binding protein [Candidatus Pacebacteria bacterium]|nr:ABC transporter ATP-binding protein [Candidatus Paceibacterota bacterium]